MDFHRFLTAAVIDSVVAMPSGSGPDIGTYLDVILKSGHDTFRLAGAAADMADRGEAFYLDLQDYDEANWWPFLDGREHPDWRPVDLTARWDGSAIGELWRQPRCVRYYADGEDRQRGLKPLGALGSSAVIELTPMNNPDPESRVTFFASIDYPCSVEVFTGSDRGHLAAIWESLIEVEGAGDPKVGSK